MYFSKQLLKFTYVLRLLVCYRMLFNFLFTTFGAFLYNVSRMTPMWRVPGSFYNLGRNLSLDQKK
jgi:hypothetical protein